MKNCPGCFKEVDKYAIACQYCGRVAEEWQKRKKISLSQVAGKSRTLTVTIACTPTKVYGFVSNLANLPKWAKTFAKSVRKSKGAWKIETPQGPAGIRMAKKNTFGILDHHVEPKGAPELLVPMRVVPNARGSEVIFTLFQMPGMSEENFERDIHMVEKDLQSLKEALEKL